jgi:hypothetical protein
MRCAKRVSSSRPLASVAPLVRHSTENPKHHGPIRELNVTNRIVTYNSTHWPNNRAG